MKIETISDNYRDMLNIIHFKHCLTRYLQAIPAMWASSMTKLAYLLSLMLLAATTYIGLVVTGLNTIIAVIRILMVTQVISIFVLIKKLPKLTFNQ